MQHLRRITSPKGRSLPQYPQTHRLTQSWPPRLPYQARPSQQKSHSTGTLLLRQPRSITPHSTDIGQSRLEKSRAQSFAWLLEECSNIDLEIKTYKRTQKKTAPDELKKVYPLGKSPVVQIWVPGRDTPITIAESGAIAEYLCDHFAEHLVPAKWTAGQEGKVGGESEEWMRYRYFMHYCEGSLMSLMVSRVIVHGMLAFFGPLTRQKLNLTCSSHDKQRPDSLARQAHYPETISGDRWSLL